MGKRIWTDEQLGAAVASESSWRGVLKALGLKSSSSIQIVKRHATRLGLDTSHFTGPRRWSDRALMEAVRDSENWREVVQHLGLLHDSRTMVRLKGQALRLGLDSSHLQSSSYTRPVHDDLRKDPLLAELRKAAPTLAASWFTLRGLPVAFPTEPQCYDLLVTVSGAIRRVQVKTTTYTTHSGRWQVGIGHRPYVLDKSAAKAPYDPDALDFFFIVTGNGEVYLIPIEVLAGLTNIYLDSYSSYKVGDVSSLLN